MKSQRNNFPIPTGEVTAYTPDGAVRVSSDNDTRDGLRDANFVSGGPSACGYGAFGDHPGPFETGNADVTTTATPRRKPDYGSPIG